MTVEILIKLYSTADFSLSSESSFWCALLIGFFGFLRKSSLIPASASVPMSKRLNRADIVGLCLDHFPLFAITVNRISLGSESMLFLTRPVKISVFVPCKRCCRTWARVLWKVTLLCLIFVFVGGAPSTLTWRL